MLERERLELEKAGLFDKDSDYAGAIGEAVMELLEKFEEQGHSGYSAALTAGIFKTLADGNTLSSLLGTDDEWEETFNGLMQNKRCSSVFKNGDGSCTYIYALKFKTDSSSCWTGRAKTKSGEVITSEQSITFPFMPRSFEIDVEDDVNSDDFFIVKDDKQLEEALRYFKGRN